VYVSVPLPTSTEETSSVWGALDETISHTCAMSLSHLLQLCSVSPLSQCVYKCCWRFSMVQSKQCAFKVHLETRSCIDMSDEGCTAGCFEAVQNSCYLLEQQSEQRTRQRDNYVHGNSLVADGPVLRLPHPTLGGCHAEPVQGLVAACSRQP